MTQQGTIKKLLPNGLAEVEVTRRSACGHDCAKCGGCGGLETQTLYVTARNHAHASVGDRVLLEGETRRCSALPCSCIAAARAVFCRLRRRRRNETGGGLSALIGGVLFVVGILAAMWYSHAEAQKRSAVCHYRAALMRIESAKPWFHDRQF
ncbi:MAG: SoxR reducing system RseC family protein [Butyricicoccus sp.]